MTTQWENPDKMSGAEDIADQRRRGMIPRAPRGTDRRQAPRRAEEATLHYATLNLVAAALAVDSGEVEAIDDLELLRRVATLRRAAQAYREAEAEVLAPDQGRG